VFDEIKRELSSLKLLTILLTFAVGIYLLQFLLEFLRNFSDIILILVFGWLVSFILEPFVDIFTNYLKIPRVISTALVFILAAVLLILTFAVNLVTVLILSFYLVIDKQNINRRIFALSPKKYHDSIRFVQKIVDQSFASFVRIQALWGVIGGIITWIVLTIFGVNFAASTSIMAGILTAVPVIGPIIGVIPPLFVALIDKPNEALIIFLIIFIIQQFIFNVFGPKLIGKAFNINPIVVILSLLIGIKIAGATGAVFAIPVISIVLIVSREFYKDYKEDEA